MRCSCVLRFLDPSGLVPCAALFILERLVRGKAVTPFLLATLAKVWHYHVAKFRVEEEEHRFRFVLDPCGSGGRLFRGEFHLDSFHYGDELSPLVEEKHSIAFNREGAPHYCTHCASSNRDMFKGGGPLVFVVDGMAQMRPGMACHQYLWKKNAPREVEPRLLEQVGMAELLPVKQVE